MKKMLNLDGVRMNTRVTLFVVLLFVISVKSQPCELHASYNYAIANLFKLCGLFLEIFYSYS